MFFLFGQYAINIRFVTNQTITLVVFFENELEPLPLGSRFVALGVGANTMILRFKTNDFHPEVTFHERT